MNNVFEKDQILTTTNLISKGGGGTTESPTGVLDEISLKVTHAVLNRADRTSIVDDLSYINTANCNGFKKANAPDNGGCTSCSCTSKANSGEGWYIDANECKGTAEFDDDSTAIGFNGYYAFDFATVSAGYESVDSGTTADGFFLGVSFPEVGAGTFDIGMGTTGNFAEGDTEYYIYEASYTYPLNDFVSITPGVYIKEDTTDTTGFAVKTSFSF